MTDVIVRRLAAADASARVPALAAVLIDCVEGGASVGFMPLMTVAKATRFFEMVAAGDAARLYSRIGWTRVGDVPNFALMPDGSFCSTTYFYKAIDASLRREAS